MSDDKTPMERFENLLSRLFQAGKKTTEALADDAAESVKPEEREPGE